MDTNTLNTEIVKKVKQVRKLQKEYFQGRDRNVLQLSKNAERELDKLLEQTESKQQTIF